MRPLIVAALTDEVRILRSKMVCDSVIHFKPAILYRGQMEKKELDLLVTGMGRERMRKGLEEALSLCPAPRAILHTGYCGGASPLAAPGALILPGEVIDFSDGARMACDTDLLAGAKKMCEERKWPYQVGGIVTLDQVVSGPHEKADIGATHGAIALEMEGAPAAKIAHGRKIPFLAVKGVLDAVVTSLPDFRECLFPAGEVRLMKLAGRLLKNPREMADLFRLQYCASQARGALTAFVEAWL